MPFKTSWADDKRIIYTKLTGTLTAQEAQEMSDTHAKFLSEGTAPVHLVVDVTGLSGVPTNLRQNTSMGGYLRHSALGWTVLIGGNVLVNFMVSVIGQVFKFRYSKRETLDEALAYLIAQDQTLTGARERVLAHMHSST
jgi:SpoIIAA-like